MSAKILFKKISLVLLKILLTIVYVIVLIATCFGVAIWFSSPVVLGYVTVMDYLAKPITLFNGNIAYLWLCAVSIVFVPLIIYSVIYRIRQKAKAKKAFQEALAKAKEEGEKSK